MEWEAAIRAQAVADFEDKQAVPLSIEGLAGRRPLFIGFDEVDKIGKTEWLLNHFHGLIDAAIAGHHQVVLTTNLKSDDEFKAALGESLAWRILQQPESNGRGGLGCTWANFA